MKSKKMTLSGLFLSLCLILPFFIGQIPQIGKALSPMHIPVFLCGFLCGWQYGLTVGFIAPLLRSVLFHMPAIFPEGVAMAFELAAYGTVSGLLYAFFRKRHARGAVYPALLGAMLAGRLVWGTVRWLEAMLFALEFPFSVFLAGAFLNAVPGIVCHILLIPPLVMALGKRIGD